MAHTTSAAMIRTVALLFLTLIAASSARKLWNDGFYQTYITNTELPRTAANATNAGWVVEQGPTTNTGYDDLTMMIKSSDCTTGLFYDGDNLAGYMVALLVNTTTLCYDATEQGLLTWTCSADGEKYYASTIYFVPEDSSSRTYDAAKVVQTDNLTFLSNNCKMDTMPNNLTTIKQDDTSVWDKQRCVLWMGLHYYRNMTTSTTCDNPFATYFGLYDDNTNQLMGVGFMAMGTCAGVHNEHPARKAVKFIVNNGPQCLYDKVDECGACTRHIFWVNHPLQITCL